MLSGFSLPLPHSYIGCNNTANLLVLFLQFHMNLELLKKWTLSCCGMGDQEPVPFGVASVSSKCLNFIQKQFQGPGSVHFPQRQTSSFIQIGLG